MSKANDCFVLTIYCKRRTYVTI